MRLSRFLLVLAFAWAPGCSLFGASDPEPLLSVLFVGNSLTYVNDLPEAVAELGRVYEHPIRVETVAGPNLSLEDHWVLGDAPEALASGEWDVIVMQQGPSTLQSSREHLIEWVGAFADEAREQGVQPAVYMVWPPQGTPIALSDASYTAAAEAHSATLLPAGRAWSLAMQQGTLVELYGPDGFHPSPTGTLLAALTIYGGLHELPTQLPSEIRVGGQPLALRAQTRGVLLRAARDALVSVGG